MYPQTYCFPKASDLTSGASGCTVLSLLLCEMATSPRCCENLRKAELADPGLGKAASTPKGQALCLGQCRTAWQLQGGKKGH